MNIYLDNSATSWPKPPGVVKAISEYLNEYGASPGRSGYNFALRAAREVFETRELLASFFNVPSSEKVIFSSNATHAINIALKGILNKGDHVIISNIEHNSVYRPLRYLENEGIIELTTFDFEKFNIEQFKINIKSNTKMVVTAHGSNVTGNILPIRQIGEICKTKGIIYLVDAAQTAGLIPIDMLKDNIDILAFTGHKKLYGPPGIGGLCINGNIAIKPLIQGGTGSKSEMDTQPDFYPDRLEAGTLNTVGIVGLKAGVQFILEKGIDHHRNKLFQLTEYFIKQLTEIDGVKIYNFDICNDRLPIVSMNIKNFIPSDLACILDKEYGIMVRAGLHCSPLAHKTAGTFPQGTVRFSLGSFNTEEEIKYTVDALKKIVFSEK
ncbi:MAG: aminotransferase class V-fold PLP-dependent enzyme [Bacteroidetes bacterium]|nr:aminotransferase class V-fold PLP-dependent enzyme [Bacteroidota bacterium]